MNTLRKDMEGHHLEDAIDNLQAAIGSAKSGLANPVFKALELVLEELEGQGEIVKYKATDITQAAWVKVRELLNDAHIDLETALDLSVPDQPKTWAAAKDALKTIHQVIAILTGKTKLGSPDTLDQLKILANWTS